MLKQRLWAVFAMGIALLFAGATAPLTLLFLPEDLRRPATLWGIAVVCTLAAIVVVSGMGKRNDRERER
jgi:hypothetical protein